jgi:hypothetical protein
MLPLKRTRKITEAHYGYCRECGHFLGCQYWDLSKTRWMHERGTGHKLELYVVCERDEATHFGNTDWLDNLILEAV